MTDSRPLLADFLAGKTHEAMYDELHARRCLSAEALRSPGEVIEFIKVFLRTSRQRPMMPANLIERLVKALAGSEFLNEAGQKLCEAGDSGD